MSKYRGTTWLFRIDASLSVDGEAVDTVKTFETQRRITAPTIENGYLKLDFITVISTIGRVRKNYENKSNIIMREWVLCTSTVIKMAYWMNDDWYTGWLFVFASRFSLLRLGSRSSFGPAKVAFKSAVFDLWPSKFLAVGDIFYRWKPQILDLAVVSRFFLSHEPKKEGKNYWSLKLILSSRGRSTAKAHWSPPSQFYSSKRIQQSTHRNNQRSTQ